MIIEIHDWREGRYGITTRCSEKCCEGKPDGWAYCCVNCAKWERLIYWLKFPLLVVLFIPRMAWIVIQIIRVDHQDQIEFKKKERNAASTGTSPEE